MRIAIIACSLSMYSFTIAFEISNCLSKEESGTKSISAIGGNNIFDIPGEFRGIARKYFSALRGNGIWQKRSINTLAFEGAITPASVQSLASSLTPEINTLVINSPGGNGKSSLKMAKLIIDKNLTVEVDGICVSACTDMVFAAKKVKLNGVIGFHGSAMGCLKYGGSIEMVKKYGINGYISLLLQGNSEKRFYSELKKSPQIDEISSLPDRGVGRGPIGMYVPSIAVMKKHGINVEGSIDVRYAEFANWLATTPGLGTYGFTSYVGEHPAL